MWVSAAAVFCEFAMLVSLSSPGLFRLALKALAPTKQEDHPMAEGNASCSPNTVTAPFSTKRARAPGGVPQSAAMQ